MRILLPLSGHARSAVESFYGNIRGGLVEALRELGHEAVEFEYAQPLQASAAEQTALFRLLLDRPCDLAIDLCGWGCGLSGLKVWDGSPQGEFIFDAADMAYMGLMLDQPWFQPVPAMQATRLYLGASDRQGAEQVALIYPGKAVRKTLFVPPATRAANDRSRPFAERAIDVLYVGNLQNPALGRQWEDAPDRERFDAAVAAAVAQPDVPLHRVVLDTLRQSGAEPSPDVLADTLRQVDFYMRSHGRIEAVRAAAACGASVHVLGDGWDRVALPANVVPHPSIDDYGGMLAMAGAARICLDSSSYLGGANDRVFNYAVNRAFCVTNAGAFPREVFGDDGGVGFYSMARLDELGVMLRAALDNPRRLEERGRQAAATALSTQTWRQRLEDMLGAVGEE